MSFSFGGVKRVYVEPSAVGRLLSGKALDSGNPVVASFLQEEAWDCLLIDSVITSSDFSINVERRATQDFKLNVPAIEQILSEAKAQIAVVGSAGLSLTFRGLNALTFAFSCQRLILDQSGNIIQMPPDTQSRAFAPVEAPVLLTDGSGLLEWDVR